jgi:hypothetical protein
MNRDEFWSSDDEEAVLAEYIISHSMASGFDGDGFVMSFGDADRVPPLPEENECFVCGTPIIHISDLGWRHLFGFHDRQRCQAPIPSEQLDSDRSHTQ